MNRDMAQQNTNLQQNLGFLVDSGNVDVFAAYYHWQKANVNCPYFKKELSQSCREVRFSYWHATYNSFTI